MTTVVVPLLALLQYSKRAQQNGNMPFFGLLVGLAVGILAGAKGTPEGQKRATTPAAWAGAAGAILFAVFTALKYPDFNAGVAILATYQALTGLIWCGIWGFLGGMVGRKLRKRRPSELTGTPAKKFPVRGLPDGEEAWIANFGSHPHESWRILRAKNGVQSEWTGDYTSAEEALSAFQKQFDESKG